MPNAVAALDPAVGEDWKLPVLHPAPSPPKPPELPKPPEELTPPTMSKMGGARRKKSFRKRSSRKRISNKRSSRKRLSRRRK